MRPVFLVVRMNELQVVQPYCKAVLIFLRTSPQSCAREGYEHNVKERRDGTSPYLKVLLVSLLKVVNPGGESASWARLHAASFSSVI